ncbi:hypothetical protein [Microbacterium jejuense]|uniref:hypothetical protein n=1 Tax=Microbacterium jejuense TaxID=1263637 RepID=UPI0031EF9729
MNDSERATILGLLHESGLQGTDATTAVDAVIKLSGAETLAQWHDENANLGRTELTARYGHDPVRAARVLQVRVDEIVSAQADPDWEPAAEFDCD